MNLCGEGLLGKRSVRSTALRTQFSRGLRQFSLPQKSVCEWTKIFDIRESNPGQLDGNELGYHYPNVEWYLAGGGYARTMIYKVEFELAGSNGWCAALLQQSTFVYLSSTMAGFRSLRAVASLAMHRGVPVTSVAARRCFSSSVDFASISPQDFVAHHIDATPEVPEC